MSIVTKTGDDGSTSLFSGMRVSKNDQRIELIGDLDELNAHLGLTDLEHIQAHLFEIGAIVAGATEQEKLLEPMLFSIEKIIESLEAQLPPLQNFILPNGPLHIARAICRRAERKAVAIQDLPPGIRKYLNRLSDYLFFGGT